MIDNIKANEEILDFLITLVEEILDIEDVDIKKPFMEIGLESVDVPYFIKCVIHKFNIEVPITSIFDYSDIYSYTNYIFNVIHGERKEEIGSEEKNIEEYYKEKAAIVGMSCRFPGGANNPDEFWDALVNHKDLISDIPDKRWDIQKYYSPNKSEQGKMYVTKGGFLNQPIDQFDAAFFNMSPKEAQSLDPQQRLLLELTWEAFENAGFDIGKYQGSNTGVYIGIAGEEYSLAHYKSGDLKKIDAYSLTGTTFSTACGRISYFFGFEGPSMSIDTACSSSLTALHTACKAIEMGEIDTAVVAGVNLMLSPATNICFSKIEAVSEDGYSKSFDASANGYSRSEGSGVILLKRLKDALVENNNILGIVRGTAINQDGKSNGLTAPSGSAQEKVIERALKDANLGALEVNYIEMHGTGTKLGDPIEANAVINKYCKGRENGDTLLIGSVKSNMGHLEAAAGMASIMKVLLSFKYNIIPGNLHFNIPNPFIEWDENPIKVVDANMEWKYPVKIAGINGFGFGGSNAHVILEQPPNRTDEYLQTEKEFYGLKVAGKTKNALVGNVKNLHTYIVANPEIPLHDIIYSNNIHKSDFDYRFFVISNSREELLERMECYLSGIRSECVWFSDTKVRVKDIAFLYTGQGSQYIDMGKELYKEVPVFQKAFNECNILFQDQLNVSLTDLIYEQKSEEKISQTLYAQPLIFSIEYAITKMWEHFGIVPDIVMGHSIGEYAAAVTSGILDLNTAVHLVTARAKLMDIAPGGGMMSIFESEENIGKLIDEGDERISIAVINARNNLVVAGDNQALELLAKKASEKNIKTSKLHVSHAFHTEMLNPILDDFMTIAANMNYNPSNIAFISSKYGRKIDKDEILGKEYWTEHIRDKVNFHNAIESVKGQNEILFLEIGAAKVLSLLSRMSLSPETVIISSMDRKTEDFKQILMVIGELYCNGVSINWASIYFSRFNKVQLPSYAFDKQKYWLQPVHSFEQYINSELGTFEKFAVIGKKITNPYLKNMVIYQNTFTRSIPFFMGEHIIFDTAIAPAAAHIAMLFSIVQDLKKESVLELEHIEFHKPLIANNGDVRDVQFLFLETNLNPMQFQIISKDAKNDSDKWLTHCQGNIRGQEYSPESQYISINELEKLYPENTSESTVYDVMKKFGFELGDGFTRIKKVWNNQEGGVCYIEPKQDLPINEAYEMYPGTMDSVLQSLLAVSELCSKMNSNSGDYHLKTAIPISIGNIKYYYKAAKCYWCHVKVDNSQKEGVLGNIDVYNERGELVLEIRNLLAKLTNRNSLLKDIHGFGENLFYLPKWIESGEKPARLMDKEIKYILVSNGGELGTGIGSKFESNGIEYISVLNGDSYSQVNSSGYKISLQNKEHLHRVFTNISKMYGDSEFTIIYIWDEKSYDIEDVSMDASISLLLLVQTISEFYSSGKTKLSIVTRDAQNRGNVDINLGQSLIWGLSQVIRLEYFSIWGGIIDFCRAITAESIDLLLCEISAYLNGQVCLCEDDKRWIPKLSKYEDKQDELKEKVQIFEDASYLITGGTGGIGIVYAEYLIESNAKYIILLSRGEAKLELLEKIKQWQATGVSVVVRKIDISKKFEMKDLLDEGMPMIRGVIHAAGILSDKMIKDQNRDSLEAVFSAKVFGTINVHNVTKDCELDFFVMISSIASLIGNIGQANYVAANYFMNMFSQYRRKKGLQSTSVCWGPWATVGMASKDKENIRRVEKMGLYSLPNEMCIQLVDRLFEITDATILAADVDWDLYNLKSGNPELQNYLFELLRSKTSKEDATIQTQNFNILEDLQRLEEEARYDLLLKHLRRIISGVMGYAEQDIMVDESITEQGADSLMIFSMRTEISKLISQEIDISVFFNYPTLISLNEYLLQKYLVTIKEDDPNIESVEDLLSELNSWLD